MLLGAFEQALLIQKCWLTYGQTAPNLPFRCFDICMRKIDFWTWTWEDSRGVRPISSYSSSSSSSGEHERNLGESGGVGPITTRRAGGPRIRSLGPRCDYARRRKWRECRKKTRRWTHTQRTLFPQSWPAGKWSCHYRQDFKDEKSWEAFFSESECLHVKFWIYSVKVGALGPSFKMCSNNRDLIWETCREKNGHLNLVSPIGELLTHVVQKLRFEGNYVTRTSNLNFWICNWDEGFKMIWILAALASSYCQLDQLD